MPEKNSHMTEAMNLGGCALHVASETGRSGGAREEGPTSAKFDMQSWFDVGFITKRFVSLHVTGSRHRPDTVD